ncbi:uncharacterized protein B0H18DRAFT_561945 [Fomitopsis serialis]|uniref:uncharacterized protein n=1 Tax=Fomitopsis serialis TaxID=139415 RepID=UPI0020084149|nr:uncharacterized protein B0H18DRAFT_561945 [Neoantrodia serialis]KAH9921470.1 hypothetical protein B0H18DRAFT_561945 [Neoantrodia serialis]
MLPGLPVELHERILEHLQDERRTLRMCSLTCRAWVFFAQRHLFRKVRIERRPDSSAFLAVLQASTTGIADHVRELNLLGVLFTTNGLPPPELQHIIRLLVNLETLSIEAVDWPRAMDIMEYSRIASHSLSDAVAFLFPAPTLKALRLWNVHFESANDLLHLLVAFPSLSSVRLVNVSLNNVPERLAQSDGDAHRLRIEGLYVENYTTDGILVLFVDRLLKPPFETHLRRIDGTSTTAWVRMMPARLFC